MTFLEWLQALSYVAIVLGIPAALIQLYLFKRKEQRDREWGTYNSLDDMYVRYQELCLENLDLDVTDFESTNPTNDAQKRELILFTVLLSVFERAFLMYREQPKSLRKRQWEEGWSRYIDTFCQRGNFRKAWTILGDQFDSDFRNEMNRRLVVGGETNL